MQKYFQRKYKNDPFHLFSVEHLLTLLIIGLLGVCLFVFRQKLRHPKSNDFFRFSLAILLVISEITYHIWLIRFNAWSLRTSLPLQLSDMAVILTIVMLLTKNISLFKFIYFAGLGSTIQAMLTPNLGIYSFPHFRYIEFYISHGGVFLACLFMVLVERYQPTIRSLWVTILIVNIYGACVFFINHLVDANYLFIMKKPENPSLLDFLGPWPWYILSLEGVIVISFYLLYSPFWFYRKINGRE
jgi:hypothetical integral membrane protein (TIGR02206 family)